jgi:hypothetical protein
VPWGLPPFGLGAHPGCCGQGKRKTGPSLSSLPHDVVGLVVELLTPGDLNRCAGVCRAWRRTFDTFWKPRCLAMMPALEPMFPKLPYEGYR